MIDRTTLMSSRRANALAFRFIMLCALLAFPSTVLSRTHSVAVMPFENTTNDPSLDWLSLGIPETLTNDLLAVKGIVMVERLQLRKVMEEQKLYLTGAVDSKTVVKVGKLVGANILVVGAFQNPYWFCEVYNRWNNTESCVKCCNPMEEVAKLFEPSSGFGFKFSELVWKDGIVTGYSDDYKG